MVRWLHYLVGCDGLVLLLMLLLLPKLPALMRARLEQEQAAALKQELDMRASQIQVKPPIETAGWDETAGALSSPCPPCNRREPLRLRLPSLC